MNKQYELYIDSFTFFIKVTDYHHQPALGPSADSDWDCYGYTEIDWDVTSVTYCNEDGNETEVQVDIEEYSELIEEKLLELIHEELEEDCRDCDHHPEPDYYDY